LQKSGPPEGVAISKGIFDKLQPLVAALAGFLNDEDKSQYFKLYSVADQQFAGILLDVKLLQVRLKEFESSQEKAVKSTEPQEFAQNVYDKTTGRLPEEAALEELYNIRKLYERAGRKEPKEFVENIERLENIVRVKKQQTRARSSNSRMSKEFAAMFAASNGRRSRSSAGAEFSRRRIAETRGQRSRRERLRLHSGMALAERLREAEDRLSQ